MIANEKVERVHQTLIYAKHCTYKKHFTFFLTGMFYDTMMTFVKRRQH